MQMPTIAYPDDKVLIALGRQEYLRAKVLEVENKLATLRERVRGRADAALTTRLHEETYSALDDLIATAVNAREQARIAFGYHAALADAQLELEGRS